MTVDTTIAIRVEWEPDDDGNTPDVTLVSVPESVYADGMIDWDDPVSEWLSDTYGYLVRGWKLEGKRSS